MVGVGALFRFVGAAMTSCAHSLIGLSVGYGPVYKDANVVGNVTSVDQYVANIRDR